MRWSLKSNSIQLFATINNVLKKEVLPFSNGIIVERRNAGTSPDFLNYA